MLSRSRRERRSRGQSVVEFALILPAFLLLLLIAVDAGRLFFTYIQLNNMAREGAAYAAMNPTTDSATLTPIAAREANVQTQRGEGSISVTVGCVDSSGTALACSSALGGSGAGNRVTVGVDETFTFLTPLIGNFWPGGLHIGTSATAAVAVYAAGGGGGPGGACTAPPTSSSFTWISPDPTNQPNLVSVNANASQPTSGVNRIIGYNWDFDGASTDPGGDYLREGVTQDFTYAGGGTYTIKLTVSNGCGDVSSSKQITLGTTTCQAPKATFTWQPVAILDKHGNITNWNHYQNKNFPGTPFTFDGTSSSFMADPACHPVWSWDVGDQTTPADATTPIVTNHVYQKAGTFTVKLTVTNDAGTDSTTHVFPVD